MASTNEILEAVRSRLEALPLSAEFWPEEEKEYRLNHPVGAALVGYAGVTYSPSRDTFAVIQRREITLPVILVFRQLNGPDGAVDMLDRVRALLVGFRPPDCGKLHMQSERFAGQASRLWWYELTLTCAGMLVEATEFEDGPKLTQLDFASVVATKEATDEDSNSSTRQPVNGAAVAIRKQAMPANG